MSNRHPRSGWPHRRAVIARYLVATAGAISVIVLVALHEYRAVAADLVLLAVLFATIWFATRPSPTHVDAWNRNHRNRIGDRW